jgi:hypothetical protein
VDVAGDSLEVFMPSEEVAALVGRFRFDNPTDDMESFLARLVSMAEYDAIEAFLEPITLEDAVR